MAASGRSLREAEQADQEWAKEMGRPTWAQITRREFVPGPRTFEVRKAAEEALRRELPLDATLPAVAREVHRMAGDPSVTLDQLSGTLARDPFMAAQLVALANSPFYRPRNGSIQGVREAVQRVGIDGVRTSILLPALKSRLLRGAETARLWSHGNEVATLCPFVAGLAGVKPEAAHLAGLLHDAGRLFLTQLSSILPGGAGPLTPAAIDSLHEWAGSALLERWGLPRPIVEAAGNHHHPERVQDEEGRRLTYTVALCDALVRGAEAAIEEDPSRIEYVVPLGLPPTPMRSLLRRVPELIAEARL